MSDERFNAFIECHQIVRAEGIEPMYDAMDMRAAYDQGLKDARDGMASKLIDTWSATHGGKPIPWRIAVGIIAVIGRMPKDEENRLLSLDNGE